MQVILKFLNQQNHIRKLDQHFKTRKKKEKNRKFFKKKLSSKLK